MDSRAAGGRGRLIIVSNRLPVKVQRGESGLEFSPSAGGLATSLDALREKTELLWLGWPGLTTESQAEQDEIAARLQSEFGCLPIFLPPEDFERYYYGFSNGCLWPLFHYFPQYAHYDPQEWAAYVRVNRLFCERLVEVARPEDRLWIHDFHLMGLPAMMRAALPQAAIGFFLHIPFPSSEILRILPWREAILDGLLGADLIGFHTFGYARHFLSSLLRLKGIEQEFGRVVVDGRPVRTDTFPLGIDVERFAGAHRLPEVQAELAHLRSQAGDRQIILSVDRLDFTKGILERLHAFAALLERDPERRGAVSLLNLCVPSRTRVPEYASLKRQVDEIVGRINGEFGRPGWVPIWYLYRQLPFEELTPLYLLADVALVTPLRDGMNLVAKEYLATRADGTGVLILSETAGSAEELGEALIVNPHDQDGIVRALQQALEMPPEEQVARNRPMVMRLKRYDTRRWAEDFLNQLEAARTERPKVRQRSLEFDHRRALIEAYRASERRLLLLDYDGTLRSFVAWAKDASPDEELLDLLRSLASDERNTLVVISGRDHETLGRWLGELDIDLVAEHGAWYRLAAGGTWALEAEAAMDGWRDQLRPLLEVYVDRTPGAYLEDKGTSLVFHYRGAEPELGSLRSMELVEMLDGYLANTPLQVQQGSKIVEVKQSGVSKGRAARRWLKAAPAGAFILAVGDDVTDEDTFEAVPEDAWSIKVGAPGQSRARYLLPSPRAVRALLWDLAAPSGEDDPV